MIRESQQVFLYLEVLTWGQRGLAYRSVKQPQHVVLAWRQFTIQGEMAWKTFEKSVDRALYRQATIALGRLEIESNDRHVMVRVGERKFAYPKHILDTWRMALHPSTVICMDNLDVGLARRGERVYGLRITPQRAVELHNDAVALLKYIEGRENWWSVESVKRIGVTYGEHLIVIETLAGSVCVTASWGKWVLPARLIQQLPQVGQIDDDVTIAPI